MRNLSLVTTLLLLLLLLAQTEARKLKITLHAQPSGEPEDASAEMQSRRLTDDNAPSERRLMSSDKYEEIKNCNGRAKCIDKQVMGALAENLADV
ncbi:maker658 [Drosophila busckii]|uniref:Maker658 n=1 Tax=Drosophila busckii TaxID=30019 RepID=A0A0M4EN70_DROBS|nr:maker658 [Drosophila busckii]